MTIHLRASQPTDLPFLRKMLYEAVFWRAADNKPAFEEGLAFPDVSKALAAWGERDGDTAVVATINSNPVGAAWIHLYRQQGFLEYADKGDAFIMVRLI